MKKKTAVLILCALMAAGLAACGGSSGENSSSVSGESTGTSTVSSSSQEDAIMSIPLEEGDDWKLEDCIVLGDYKGLRLTKTVGQVTEEEVDSYIQSQATAEEVTDENAAVQDGDTVNIDYVGKIDGKEFDGGSAQGSVLVIGSDTFIDGFEDGLIGMKKGETKDLNLTFPDDYGNTDVAGKAVVFTVTLNSISRAPEQDDAWVSSYTDGKYTSMDDYRAYMKESLQEGNDEAADQQLNSDAWEQIEKTCTFLKLPKSYVEEGSEEFEKNVTSQAEQYNATLDDFITQNGLTAEEYKTRKEQYGRYTAESRLLLEALMQAEQLADDSQEYKDALAETEKAWGMTEDALKEQYGEDTLKQYVETQMVLDKVIGYAEVTEVQTDGTDSTTVTNAGGTTE
ncbi:MAG TPA: trigger factor [Lachnospiraceae bacterium]|nr:trigger factor [Lachnospiraceae bacterium]